MYSNITEDYLYDEFSGSGSGSGNSTNTTNLYDDEDELYKPSEPISITLQDNYIQETVPTKPGRRYMLSFYANQHESISEHYSHPTGYVRIPGNHQHFVVKPLTDSGQFPSFRHVWQKQVFYMTAAEHESDIVIGADGRRNAIMIREVSLVELLEGDRDPHPDPRHPHADHVQPIHVHATTVGDLTSVSVNWDMVDAESPVVKHMWAIGSVKGIVMH